MRFIIALAPAVLLGACQVTEDKANDQVTVEYSQDVAENAADVVVDSVNEAATAIVSDTREAGAAVGNIDLDVRTERTKDSAPANSN